MATDSPPPSAPSVPLKWPNRREDYEIQEVIGTLVHVVGLDNGHYLPGYEWWPLLSHISSMCRG